MMQWSANPYAFLLLGTALGLMVLALTLLWRRRHSPAGRTALVLAGAATVWIASAALELASLDLAHKLLWTTVGVLAMCFIPTAWLALVLQYAGREQWLNPPMVIALGLVPGITVVLALTNGEHSLILAQPRVEWHGRYPLLHVEWGAGLRIFFVYSYLQVLAGVMWLARALRRAGLLRRWQGIGLLAAVLAVLVVHFGVDWLHLVPVPSLHWTPLVLGLTAPAIAWTLYRLQLRDIIPLARAAIFAHLSDPVVVVDSCNRVVDLNAAAEELFGQPHRRALGRPLEALWPEAASPASAPQLREVTIAREGETHVYDVHITPLLERGRRLLGWALVWRDVTPRVAVEQALREAHAELERRVQEQTAALREANQRLEAEVAERTRSEQMLAQRARALATLHEIVLEINAQHGLQPLLRTIVSHSVKLLGVHVGELYLMAPGGQSLELVVSQGLPEEVRGTVLRLGEGLAGRVAEQGKPLSVEDYSVWEGRLVAYEHLGLRRALGVPLRCRGTVIGVIDVIDRERSGGFATDQVQLLSLLADQAALAIENARLYERLYQELGERMKAQAALREAQAVLERRVEVRTAQLAQEIEERKQAEEELRRTTERLRLLHEIDRAILAARSPAAIAQAALAHLRRLIPSPAAGVALFDVQEREAQVIALDADEPALLDLVGGTIPLEVVLGVGKNLELLRRGEVLVLPVPLSDALPLEIAPMLAALGIGAVLLAPLRYMEEITGFLVIAGRAVGAFQPEDRAIAEQVASSLAVALHGAHLLERLEERTRALERSLAEKELLLHEVRHRVKNNLQVIDSLLSLQADHTVNKPAHEVLRESQSRVRAMGLVHELLYQSREVNGVSAQDYLGHLTRQLLDLYRGTAPGVRLELDVEEVRLDVDTAIPCGLIVTELVSNALKHAFPDGQGLLQVQLRRADGQLILRVEDDGIGLPPDLEERRARSLGLQLVESLTQQLGGKLEVRSAAVAGAPERPGTAFRIVFPDHPA